MRKLFILFLLLWSGVASAEAVYFHYNYPDDTYSGSPGGSCSLAIASHQPGWTFTGVVGPGANGAYSCQCRHVTGQDGWCGQVLQGSKPACASGETRRPDGSCGVPPPPPCSSPAGSTVSWTGKTGHSASPDAEQGDGPGSMPRSSPSCGISGTPKVEDCWSVPASDGGQDFFCKFSGTSDGKQAPAGTPSDGGSRPDGAKGTNMPPTKADSSGNCPGGSTQGGVDAGGTPICVGSGTNPTGANGGARGDANPTSSTTTKTTDANGNKVTTTTGTRDNGDGSKTVTKTVETEAPDGSKSSTTTQTTGLTPGGKQGQPDKPDTDFCRQHPELNVCRNSSIAGQCGQITCMGDAIQCATLREAATIQCRQKDAEDALKASPQHALGSAAASGNDPLKDSLPTPGNAAVIDVSGLNADGWLGGGAPIDDVSVSLFDRTIVIPLSKASSYLIVFRYALMVAAALVSFRILSGAILSR